MLFIGFHFQHPFTRTHTHKQEQQINCTGKLQQTTGLIQFCIEALKETDNAAFLQVYFIVTHHHLFRMAPQFMRLYSIYTAETQIFRFKIANIIYLDGVCDGVSYTNFYQVGAALINRIADTDVRWHQEVTNAAPRVSPIIDLTLDDLAVKRAIDNLNFIQIRCELWFIFVQISFLFPQLILSLPLHRVLMHDRYTENGRLK